VKTVARQIQSDQGRNFESKVFSRNVQVTGDGQDQNHTHNPQSDGIIEQGGIMSKYVAENQRDSDNHLPILMMAYRSAVHETTPFTPCELIFRRQINLPIDLQLKQPE